ncbi:hypothetical protein [Nocardiopsis sp. NRRL B-16309]|uniref:hypothetical protein n=1 Tax=Nocardiopsis sp. NRRL B-16309 TaxID=1519494 RepID=UPI0006AFDF32|nr:hypothetical protein [Nocardiopsis sp. NRRL B-16309]KOX11199.1 hypothetical protein ADL05_23280 [Nocardiopsis sp. NRRL B-16309]
MPDSSVHLPSLIGTILPLLAGAGVVIGAFAAPSGRRGLTGAAGGLILVSSIGFLILTLAYSPLQEMLSGPFGGRTVWIILDAVDFVCLALFDTGLVLLVIAATRRLAEPRPTRPPHAPVGPYQPGPSQR